MKRGIAAVLVLVLGACSTPPAPMTPALTFDHLQPLTLAVGSIERTSTYNLPFRAPNVEHVLQPSPLDATMAWARQRFKAAGPAASPLRFIVDIEHASVVEYPLAKRAGFTGLLTDEQDRRFRADLTVRLSLVRAAGDEVGFVRAVAWRETTLAESATLNQRDMALVRMTEALVNELDQTALQKLRATMPHVLMPRDRAKDGPGNPQPDQALQPGPAPTW